MPEYVVTGVPPGGDEPVEVGRYEPERWQWAEKHAAFLRDRGYDFVTVSLDDDDDGDEE